MKHECDGKLLRIYLGERDRHEGRPLFESLVAKARAAGLAGATVLRGIRGFGADHRLHTTRILRLSEDLPIVIEIVDESTRIDEFLPTLDGMILEGMITLEKVHLIAYRQEDTRVD